jgi:hypothetical protein
MEALRALRGHAARVAALGTLALAGGASLAAGGNAGDRKFTLEPVALDGARGTGTVLGLQYEFKDTLAGGAAGAGRGSETVEVEEIKLSNWRAGYLVRGMLTGDRNENPVDLQEAQLDAGYRYGRTWGVLLGGLNARYEAAQKGGGRQSVLGLAATYARVGLLRNGDAVALDLRYGQVDPKKDEARQQALGSTQLDSYDRWDIELLYIFPLELKPFDRVEFNYRYFREPGAPQAVRAAGIDRHRLLTYRIGLPRDMFIAYSSGKLPFSSASEQLYQIGFSFRLE